MLAARVRQLQAEGVSEVTVKRVGVARRLPASRGLQPPGKARTGPKGPAADLGDLWVQRLNKEKSSMQKRKLRLEGKQQPQAQDLDCEHELRVVPRLLDAQLAGRLKHWERRPPQSLQEGPLAQLLREAPRQPSPEAEPACEARGADMQLEIKQQKLLAFLECCLLTGHLPLAHHVLVTHHSRARQRRWLTLAMYNAVMLGWARKVSGGPRGTCLRGAEARVALDASPARAACYRLGGSLRLVARRSRVSLSGDLAKSHGRGGTLWVLPCVSSRTARLGPRRFWRPLPRHCDFDTLGPVPGAGGLASAATRLPPSTRALVAADFLRALLWPGPVSPRSLCFPGAVVSSGGLPECCVRAPARARLPRLLPPPTPAALFPGQQEPCRPTKETVL